VRALKGVLLVIEGPYPYSGWGLQSLIVIEDVKHTCEHDYYTTQMSIEIFEKIDVATGFIWAQHIDKKV